MRFVRTSYYTYKVKLMVIYFSIVVGGSIANMYAMNIARYKHCPQIKQQGLYGQARLVLFTSEHVSIG